MRFKTSNQKLLNMLLVLERIISLRATELRDVLCATVKKMTMSKRQHRRQGAMQNCLFFYFTFIS